MSEPPYLIVSNLSHFPTEISIKDAAYYILVFKTFDTDGNGELSEGEIQQILTRMGLKGGKDQVKVRK